MRTTTINVLLADDDIDDCSFFKEALEKLSIDATLNFVHDGEQLMSYLKEERTALPDVLFLDLNMHRKNGFECLEEIKKSSLLKNLPVIVFSTSFDQERVDKLYESGAQYFMRKPPQFPQLMISISQALVLISGDIETATRVSKSEGIISQPSREKFVLNSQSGQPS